MQSRRPTTQDQNHGFTLHTADGTYIGFLTIGEKNVDPAVVEALQDADNMMKVLNSPGFELRPYKARENTDMSSVLSIIGG